ncbi:MAG: VRR-NUC domain-containing protein [Sporocytophaga sp.]|uniref:VRR-NUC domain-containing protein n=1 Tax=Sporocytophaga sp. TaxID=2231183 RepID=UPI001B293D21|nr:VRR-NUC domain-containing protein [Sporocytophaga sp.]MBO9699256.1 VRR-NUC domain-containing protein [Sporocytophaga sp.]
MKKTKEEIEYLINKYPSVPKWGIPTTRKKKSPANELTYQIIKYVQSLGGQAYRINSQGQYDPRTKKWRYSGMKKGLADIQIILLGRFIGVEIKIGKDRQSEHQKARQEEIIKSGGYYLIAKDFEAFKTDLQTIINEIQ